MEDRNLPQIAHARLLPRVTPAERLEGPGTTVFHDMRKLRTHLLER